MRLELCILFTFIVCLLFAGCQDNRSVGYTKLIGGVQFTKYSNKSGCITNTNSHVVMIRKVLRHHGEKTQWIKELQPGASIKVKAILSYQGYYVYKDSHIVGFFLGEVN